MDAVFTGMEKGTPVLALVGSIMKIEIDLTPDEFKELFLPSEKQTEFAMKMGEAYFNAVSQMAAGTYKKTMGKVFNRGGNDD